MSRAAGAPPVARRIWLCADDYGLAPGVNAAIRELIVGQRLNATSVMVVGPSLSRAETESLSALNGSEKCVAIGLHLTLTAPFRPASDAFVWSGRRAFPPLTALISRSMLARLNPATLAEEINAQLTAFARAFGGPPEFVDGHQHVQLLPQVRDALLPAVCQKAPGSWVRQCGSNLPLWCRLNDRKALLLDVLSSGLRRRALALGVAVNPAFAGTYHFGTNADFAKLFPRFLHRMPDRGVIMCHPGHVDEELKRLDPLTDLRQKEYAYLVSEVFSRELDRSGVSLATTN